MNWLLAGLPVALLEIEDAAASLHVSPNLVRDFAKTAAKRSSQLASADAPSAGWRNAEMLAGETTSADRVSHERA